MRLFEYSERRQKTASLGVLVGTGAPTGSFATNLYSLEPVPWDDGHVGLGAAGAGEGVGRHPGEVEEDGLFYVGEGGAEEA